jgi:hypothetical protein
MRRPWPLRYISNLIGLATVLARGRDGCCFSCSRIFNISQSRAEIPRSFCSQTCEHLFIHESLQTLTLTDCARLLERIEMLLKPRERYMH